MILSLDGRQMRGRQFMKLIEVVVLMGAHCVSPVQHTANSTEAGKVHCAVMIEKDTQAGTLRIVPAGASHEPEVVAVIKRLDTAAPAAEPVVAKVRTAPQPKPAPKQAARQEAKSKCRGEARPKWYINAEGHRKYRCALPG